MKIKNKLVVLDKYLNDNGQYDSNKKQFNFKNKEFKRFEFFTSITNNF